MRLLLGACAAERAHLPAVVGHSCSCMAQRSMLPQQGRRPAGGAYKCWSGFYTGMGDTHSRAAWGHAVRRGGRRASNDVRDINAPPVDAAQLALVHAEPDLSRYPPHHRAHQATHPLFPSMREYLVVVVVVVSCSRAVVAGRRRGPDSAGGLDGSQRARGSVRWQAAAPKRAGRAGAAPIVGAGGGRGQWLTGGGPRASAEPPPQVIICTSAAAATAVLIVRVRGGDQGLWEVRARRWALASSYHAPACYLPWCGGCARGDDGACAIVLARRRRRLPVEPMHNNARLPGAPFLRVCGTVVHGVLPLPVGVWVAVVREKFGSAA